MIKNKKKILFTGMFFFFIADLLMFLPADWSKYQIKPNTVLITITFIFFISIFFFSIASNLVGKGDYLLKNDLKSGKEFILISHITIEGERKFSLVGTPSSEKIIIIYGDDDLFNLSPGQHFVIINKMLRILS